MTKHPRCAEEDRNSATPLIAHCWAGRKYGGAVKRIWSFCFKPVICSDFEVVCKSYISGCAASLQVLTQGWLLCCVFVFFFQSQFKNFEQVESVWYLGIACIVVNTKCFNPSPPRGTANSGQKVVKWVTVSKRAWEQRGHLDRTIQIEGQGQRNSMVVRKCCLTSAQHVHRVPSGKSVEVMGMWDAHGSFCSLNGNVSWKEQNELRWYGKLVSCPGKWRTTASVCGAEVSGGGIERSWSDNYSWKGRLLGIFDQDCNDADLKLFRAFSHMSTSFSTKTIESNQTVCWTSLWRGQKWMAGEWSEGSSLHHCPLPSAFYKADNS